MTVTLDSIRKGQKAKVINISGGWGIRQRLGGLGIHPGDKIILKKSAIIRGPILIEVHGNQVALGRGVARRIIVEVEE
ncbi:MAG: ferrous iron transport protein A [Candidatus Atribacteria bacterium]|nr:ferrous iron transport protein A [Candidatus Atribacteria bacterium]MCK4308349.1 ferrous iron transport protein A [Candidatus Atribacteria bacterium]